MKSLNLLDDLILRFFFGISVSGSFWMLNFIVEVCNESETELCL